MTIIDEIHGDDPLDLLWDNIQLQYAAIVRAQKLMHVKNHEDKTKEEMEYKDGNVIGKRQEVQQAWDKYATFMSIQSRAIRTLLRLVKEYDELLHKNWDITSMVQKAQPEQVRTQTDKLTGNNAEVEGLEETDNTIYGENNRKKNDIVWIRTEIYRLHPEVCSVYNRCSRKRCTYR